MTEITNIANQRVKECDRLAATVAGLNACGIEASELKDGIRIIGRGNTWTRSAAVEDRVRLRGERIKRKTKTFAFD